MPRPCNATSSVLSSHSRPLTDLEEGLAREKEGASRPGPLAATRDPLKYRFRSQPDARRHAVSSDHDLTLGRGAIVPASGLRAGKRVL